MNRRLHRWLGLWLGVWLVFMGGTGSLLALSPYVEGFRPSGPGRMPVPATLAALGSGEVRRLDFGKVDRYYFADDTIVVVDPPTGRVLGRQRKGHTFKAWVLWLHEFGDKVTGVLAVGCGLILLTGWRLQPPSRRRVLQRPSGTYAWHRWLGWLVTPGLALSLLTGFMLVNYGLLERLLGKRELPNPKPEPSASVTHPVEVLVSQAREAVPGGEPTRLLWPKKAGETFVVRLHQPGELNPVGRTFVHLHPQTGQVLSVENPLQDPLAVRWLQGAFLVHAGLYPGGFVLIGLGLTPALMWTTGLILRTRRRSRTPIKR